MFICCYYALHRKVVFKFMELAPQTKKDSNGHFLTEFTDLTTQTEWPLAHSFRVSVTHQYFEEFMTQLNEKILARWEF